jgi:Na+/H+ antiporter NhaD/arsenite permease-like protein
MLMVLFNVITADEAYAAVDLPILGLLFGTMVVSVYLERADMFRHLGRLLSWRSQGGKDLLVRTCIVSALASALFTNDTCCVVLTEFILKIARQNNLPPKPFLLALASSANIGSAATPIGNPQNLVIAVQSGISFGDFVFGILPATLVGVVVNAGILLCLYWRELSDEKCVDVAHDDAVEVVEEDDVTSHRFSPATMSHPRGRGAAKPLDGSAPDACEAHCCCEPVKPDANGGGAKVPDGAVGIHQRRGVAAGVAVANKNEEFYSAEEKEEVAMEEWKNKLWKTCVYAITFGMLVALLLGLNMSWSAITAALALIVLDFKDARPCLEKVTNQLLILLQCLSVGLQLN